MKKMITSISLLISVLLVVCVPAFAQKKPDVTGFNQQVFDYHFSRADREMNPERWIDEASKGTEIAIGAWELLAAGLYEDPNVFREALNELEEWSVQELENRFFKWLCGRFFGSAIDASAREITKSISDIHLQYIYHLDSEGNIVYDPETGEPSMIRPADEDRNYQEDLENWRNGASRETESETGAFESAIVSLYPEIAAFIPETLRSGITGQLHTAGSSAINVLRNEFERMTAREERIFAGRRTGDVWSLRKKSESKNAENVVSRIITETENICANDIDELNSRIKEASAGTGDLALQGEEWLELYKQQFDRGLRAWEEAEERFFIRRIEWEQNSGNLFGEGENAWQTAFNRLEDEKYKWELKAKDLLDTGEDFFKKSSVNLEKAIAEAKKEFEYHRQLKSEASSAKASALIDMYLISANGASAARENLLFWINQYGADNVPEFDAPDFDEWFDRETDTFWRKAARDYKTGLRYSTENMRLNHLAKMKGKDDPQYQQRLKEFQEKHWFVFEIEDFLSGHGDESTFAAFVEKIRQTKIINLDGYTKLEEIGKASDLRKSYLAKMYEARDRIVMEYGDLFGENTLKDVLNDEIAGDNFYLDEYQLALLRVKSLVNYWEKQTKIARAVSSYVNDLDTGKKTEAESIRAWEIAKKNYDEAVFRYETAVNDLNNLGSGIREKNLDMNMLSQKMLEAEEKLDQLHAEYSSLVSAGVENRSNYIRNELNSKYNALIDEYNIINQTGSNTVYNDFVESKLALTNAGNLEISKNSRDILINGDEEYLKSLADIKQEVTVLARLNIDDEFFAGKTDYGLKEDSPQYLLIRRLVNERNMLLKDNNDGTEAEKIENYDRLIRALYSVYYRQAEINIKAREAGILLFPVTEEGENPDEKNYSAVEWYYSLKGIQPVDNEKEKFYTVKLGDRLNTDLEQSFLSLLKNRLTLEIQALEFFLDASTDEQSDAAFLAQFCTVDMNTAKKIYETLCVLNEKVNNPDGFTLENIDKADEITLWFISGGSAFDGAEAFVGDALAEHQFCFSLADLYNRYGSTSFFAMKDNWNNSVYQLNELFSRYGLVTENTLLPDILDISNVIFDKSGNYAHNAAEFLFDFDQAAIQLPELLKPELEAWNDLFIEYIAFAALSMNKEIPENAIDLTEALNQLSARYKALEDYCDSLEQYDEKTLKDISDRYSEITKEETILNYQYLIVECMENGKTTGENTDTEHWRYYIDSKYVNHIGDIGGALLWVDGMKNDIEDKAGVSTRLINDIFRLYPDTTGLFSGTETGRYNTAAANWQTHLDRIEFLKSELAVLGRNYDYTLLNPDELHEEITKYEQKIKEQDEQFKIAHENYFNCAHEFTEAGARYDEQYKITGSLFNELENSRFGLEIEEAIRQRVNTAYRETDTDDLSACEEKFERVNRVFTTLSNLYNSEKARPYENEDYNLVYNNYKDSFLRLMKATDAYNALNSKISVEEAENNKLFTKYQTHLSSLGKAINYPGGYVSPGDKSKWDIKDIITIKNGRLAFSKNSTGILNGINQNDVQTMNSYFAPVIPVSDRTQNISRFETELKNFAQRMKSYFSDTKKYEQWALARDYLLTDLSAKNSSVAFLKNNIFRADELNSGKSLGNIKYMRAILAAKTSVGDYYSGVRSSMGTAQRNAWNSLGAAEKADLEFYTILTLNENHAGYSSGFSRYTECLEYVNVYKHLNDVYRHMANKADEWWNIAAVLYIEPRDLARAARERVKIPKNHTRKSFDNWMSGLSANIDSIFASDEEYLASCARIVSMDGADSTNTVIEWDEIQTALVAAEDMDMNEIDALRGDYETMIGETGEHFSSVSSCIARLVQWLGSQRDKFKAALDTQWQKDSGEQKNSETELFTEIKNLIDGTLSGNDIAGIIEKAYGNEAFARKTHLSNMTVALLDQLVTLADYADDPSAVYYDLGDELVAIVNQIAVTDMDMELLAREAEWEIQRQDIEKKHLKWRQAADTILARGRYDWKTGQNNMEASYKKWREEFSSEYRRVSGAWNDAYLTGLLEKEEWLAGVKQAADRAAVETFLSLTGTEAERLSRKMDAREPVGMMIFNSPAEGENLLAELLDSRGIKGLSSAFNYIDGFQSLSHSAVRRGTGGGIWDAGIARAAAFDLAREANSKLAESETKKLAVTLNSVAEEVIGNLSQSIEKANSNFRQNMDEMFIMQGQWRKNGGGYIKDIIVGSTLFEPVITEEERIAGYNDYQMAPVKLKTKLDEATLKNLDAFAVRGLLDNVNLEISDLSERIFGTDSEKKTISATAMKYTPEYYYDPASNKTNFNIVSTMIQLKDRYQNPGLFGEHIGYEPATKEITGRETERNEVFYDQGSGELGRLLSDFIFWSVIDGKGVALLSTAAWDKPMWDDHGSFFEAPSLRKTIEVTNQIGLAVVAAVATPFTGGASAVGFMALMAAANVSDDLMFAGLDTAYGYKTFEEAGFEFGKASLISAASTFGSGVFGGVAGIAGNGFLSAGNGLTGLAMQTTTNAVGKVAIQTAMTGIQSAATGMITSAINGITYDRLNGWGYSADAFSAGAKNALASGLTSAVSVSTSGLLKAANSGWDLSKLEGFSNLNKSNVEQLNNLAGAITAEGLGYALTGEAAFNILNTSLFTNGKINTGLVEMSFDSTGKPRMTIGTGGANVSVDTIAGAIGGALVWHTNNRIANYTESSDFKEKLTLRAQYGFGDGEQKNQLRNILNHKDEIQVETGNGFTAKTEIADGSRVIRLGNYRAGMTSEEQMRLAVILGHEAYRDGYASGEAVDFDSNFAELKNSSIAHVLMADRINEDYGWFYDLNPDFGFESYLYNASKATENTDLFDDYVRFAYENDEDYFWQWASTGNDFQNMEKYRHIPLFNAKSEERVAKLNSENLEIALVKYRNQLAKDEEYQGDMRTFVSKEGTDDELRKKLQDDEELGKKYDYVSLKFESLRLYGCMFLSTKYGLETITGKSYDTMKVHQYIKDNNLIRENTESDLSNVLMAEIMTKLSEGKYTVSLAQTGSIDAAGLYALGESSDQYIAHLRIKENGTGDGYHSVMVSGFDYTYDDNGNINGVSAVHAANPWNGGDTMTGKKSYTMDQIARWDIFKVTTNPGAPASLEIPTAVPLPAKPVVSNNPAVSVPRRTTPNIGDRIFMSLKNIASSFKDSLLRVIYSYATF